VQGIASAAYARLPGCGALRPSSDLYTHVLGNLKAEAADRLDAIFNDAEMRRAACAESGAWAKCGPIAKAPSKKLNKTRPVSAPR
jgi:hypothetical protein